MCDQLAELSKRGLADYEKLPQAFIAERELGALMGSLSREARSKVEFHNDPAMAMMSALPMAGFDLAHICSYESRVKQISAAKPGPG